MSTLRQVKDGMIAALRFVKQKNGFDVTLPDDHVHDGYTRAIAENKLERLYPKCFVTLREQMSADLMGGRREKEATFVVILIIRKQSAQDTNLQDLLCDYEREIERALLNDHTLGGTVHEVQLTETHFDGGTLDNEAAAIFVVETSRISG